MTHRLLSLGFLLALCGCAAVQRPEYPSPVRSVRPGIDVLLDDSVHLVRGRRVGLLTNQTGVDRHGISDVERLAAAGAHLAAIFTPEHGYRGVLDQENIGHGVDSATGTTLWSLYGNVRAPTPDMLAGVDVVLVDLQDIGARPYTFVSTALLTLRSARAEGIPVLLLDRPNPIGGDQVQGPVLDTAFASFVGMLPVPQRHGMTLGELTRFGNDRLGIGADVTVIPASGWRRADWFDATPLPWVRPSPSMPDLESATHYPGTVLFEATNLSVGRGTPVAYQVLGAPWLDARRVIALAGTESGVVLSDTTITPLAPQDGRFASQTIPAVRLRAIDRRAYDPVAQAVRLLWAVRLAHPDSLTVDEQRLARLAGSDAFWSAIRGGMSPEAVVDSWRAPLESFLRDREPYLLYP